VDGAPKHPVLSAEDIAPPVSNRAALLKLVGSPDLCSKRWVYEQYDTLILGNTIEGPVATPPSSARRRPKGSR